MTSTPSPDEARSGWLTRLHALIDNVKCWSEEMGWSTRQIDISLNDSEIGQHKAPALLLQEHNIRILFEPIARTAPGTEGVVDLYLMPAYDDIASLYFYDGKWHVHYMFPGTPSVGDMRDAEAKPLSRETLRDVLEAMKSNAVQ